MNDAREAKRNMGITCVTPKERTIRIGDLNRSRNKIKRERLILMIHGQGIKT